MRTAVSVVLSPTTAGRSAHDVASGQRRSVDPPACGRRRGSQSRTGGCSAQSLGQFGCMRWPLLRRRSDEHLELVRQVLGMRATSARKLPGARRGQAAHDTVMDVAAVVDGVGRRGAPVRRARTARPEGSVVSRRRTSPRRRSAVDVAVAQQGLAWRSLTAAHDGPTGVRPERHDLHADALAVLDEPVEQGRRLDALDDGGDRTCRPGSASRRSTPSCPRWGMTTRPKPSSRACWMCSYPRSTCGRRAHRARWWQPERLAVLGP